MDAPIDQTESPYEAQRRIDNVVRAGVIVAVEFDPWPQCKVQIAGNTTGWMPWMAMRAGGEEASWWAPVAGEQVLVFAPGGDLNACIALPGIYSNQMGPPARHPNQFRLQWNDLEYMEHHQKKLTIQLRDELEIIVGTGAQKSILRITGSTIRLSTPEASLDISNIVRVTPDVIAGATRLREHLHTGVSPGNDLSGPPP